MFGASIGRGAQRIIDAMVRWLAHGHINPNVLTVIGVSLNVGCGLLFGFGLFFWAGIALIVANLFDMLDGQVARLSGRVTRFGGFRDVGFLRRPERVVLFIIGALSTHPGSNNFFANRMPAVLWVLAVGSYWTFAHRMYHTWYELNKVGLKSEEISKPAAQSAGSPGPERRAEQTLVQKAG